MENTRSNVGDFDDVDDVGVGPFFSSCRRCIDAAKVSTPRAFWWSLLLLLLLLLLKPTTHATLLLVVVVVVVVVVIVLNVSSSSSKLKVVIECRLAHNTTHVWCSKHDTRFGHKSIDFSLSLSLSLSFQYHNTNTKRRRRRRDPQQKPTKLREQQTPLYFFFDSFFFGRQKVFRCVVQKHKTRETHTRTKQNKTKKIRTKKTLCVTLKSTKGK